MRSCSTQMAGRSAYTTPPDAIPWLLLTATADGPPGAFSDVSSIRRVNTVGRVVPAGVRAPERFVQAAPMAWGVDGAFAGL